MAVCELRKLACSAWVFGLVHTVQKAPSKTGGTSWYNFDNQKGFMTVIEKKPKIKNQKYDFLFVHRVASWADILDWKDGKPVCKLFGEPMSERPMYGTFSTTSGRMTGQSLCLPLCHV